MNKDIENILPVDHLVSRASDPRMSDKFEARKYTTKQRSPVNYSQNDYGVQSQQPMPQYNNSSSPKYLGAKKKSDEINMINTNETKKFSFGASKLSPLGDTPAFFTDNK